MYRRCIAVTVWEVPREVPRADHSRWCSGSVYELNTLVGGLGTPKHRKQAPGFTAPHGPGAARLRSVRSTDSGAWVQNGLAGIRDEPG